MSLILKSLRYFTFFFNTKSSKFSVYFKFIEQIGLDEPQVVIAYCNEQYKLS